MTRFLLYCDGCEFDCPLPKLGIFLLEWVAFGEPKIPLMRTAKCQEMLRIESTIFSENSMDKVYCGS